MTPIMLLTCYIRQVKSKMSVQVYAEWLYALANDAFVKLDKAFAESKLVGFFIYGSYVGRS